MYPYQMGRAVVAVASSTPWRPVLARGLILGLPFAGLMLGPLPARAQEDLQSIRREMRREMEEMQRQHEADMKKLQQQYDERLKRMEERLDAAQRATAAAQAKADQAQKTAQAKAPAPQAQTPAAQPPTRTVATQTPPSSPAPQAAPETPPPTEAPAGSTTASASAFNPAIGVVLDGKFMGARRNPNSYSMPGFALGDEAKPPPRGLSVGESEINLQANIDQVLFGNLTVSLDHDNEVSVEEAFIQSTALPWGFTVRAGRFFSGIGYLNEQHAHTWDFADAPLVYRAFLNNQYGDDGVQLRWLAPTSFFLEFGSEVFRGASFPAGGTDGHHWGVATWSAFVHAGDDINESASYRVGLSYLQTKANKRETEGLNGTDVFSGTTRTLGVDGVFKWAPDGNFADRYLKLQAEAFLQRTSGTFNDMSLPHNTAWGFYAQAVYQFMPRWRFGVRYDQVRACSLGNEFDGTTLDNRGRTLRRGSAMVDYSTSEFGRFRVQYNYDRSRPQPDQQLLFQYTVSFGSHGAHQY